MCVSVNGIIRLIESVCLGPKVIPLSGAHCITKPLGWGISILKTIQPIARKISYSNYNDTDYTPTFNFRLFETQASVQPREM